MKKVKKKKRLRKESISNKIKCVLFSRYWITKWCISDSRSIGAEHYSNALNGKEEKKMKEKTPRFYVSEVGLVSTICLFATGLIFSSFSSLVKWFALAILTQNIGKWKIYSFLFLIFSFFYFFFGLQLFACSWLVIFFCSCKFSFSFFSIKLLTGY